MNAFSKVTVYLKGEKPPIVLEDFSKVSVFSPSDKSIPAVNPEVLAIYPENAYCFVGLKQSLSVTGSELQAVHFE